MRTVFTLFSRERQSSLNFGVCSRKLLLLLLAFPLSLSVTTGVLLIWPQLNFCVCVFSEWIEFCSVLLISKNPVLLFMCVLCRLSLLLRCGPPSHIITGLIDRTTGDKPHACELCNKRFALACNLRAHMKTHEGKEPNPSILLFVTTPFYCNSFVPKTNDLSHTRIFMSDCDQQTSKGSTTGV